MNEPDLSTETHDCGADVAAYALGALEPAEADTCRQHIESCVICRDDLASFQQVVDVLPMSAPQHRVPAGLRRRLLRAIEDDVTAAPARGRARLPRPSPRRSWFALPRPALALGSLVLAAAIAVGVTQLGDSNPTRTQIITSQVIGVRGSAQVRLAGGHAELVVHHFSPPPAGKIYEVWLRRDHQPPAPTIALFSVTTNGDGDVDVPGNLRGVGQVLVTPEPAGGSRVPTHSPVVIAKL